MNRLISIGLSVLILLGLSGASLFSPELADASSGLKEKAEKALLGLAGEIQRQVNRNWHLEEKDSGLEVTIRVDVRRFGQVKSVKIIQSSGNRGFDNSAAQAVRSASPLPFPLEIRFYPHIKTFQLKLKARGGRQTMLSHVDTGLIGRLTSSIPNRSQLEQWFRAPKEQWSRSPVVLLIGLIVCFVCGYSVYRSIKSRRDKFAPVNYLIDKAYLELKVDKYFSHEMMNQWLKDYDQLRFLQNLNERNLKYAKDADKAAECRKALIGGEDYRTDRNNRWVEEELARRKDLFDSLEKYPLSDNQREAILRNDNRVLTVAGAGTGKTSTVVGKVAHLLEHQWCRPPEILLLSFSRETVRELEERVRTIGGGSVVIKTFHALGLKIISESGEPAQEVLERAPVEKYLRELLHDDRKYKNLIEYLVFHFYPNKYEDEFETAEAYNQFATSQDLRTLRAVLDEPLMTLQRERVRSFQEVQIANWLYTHGIEYQYEMQYPGYTKRYRPDFYLTQYDIYIEHFGINRDGSTRKDIDREQYQDSMLWKRSLHEQNRTVLVETYSYQFREGDVFQILEQSLTTHGVEFEPMGIEELREVQPIYDDLKVLAKLTATFLNLFKSDQVTLVELMERFPPEDYKRENLFLQLFSEVLEMYETDLASTGKIDFGDMIVKATGYIDSDEFKNPYKAIIVDEYQDISRGRARLIDSLQKQSPDLRLLCVGDDWQSIYRFTGSDLTLMTEFEKQWNAVVRIDLDHTYRFNDRLLEVSSRFITKNPTQLEKTITANISVNKPVIHISGETVKKTMAEIQDTVNQEVDEFSVLVLGRYNFTEGVRFDYSSPRVQGLTVHRSKGLEADYVIVNDMGSGKYGFPSQIREDPILSMLLAEGEGFPNGEERRLFYVAITRAKKEVWLLESKKQPPSEFLIELSTDTAYEGLVESKRSEISTNVRCPQCNSLMKKRQRSPEALIFFGCIHYPRCHGVLPGCPECNNGALLLSEGNALCSNSACDHVPTGCPSCQTGILVRRTSDEYDFIGCSAHPDCRYTEQIN